MLGYCSLLLNFIAPYLEISYLLEQGPPFKGHHPRIIKIWFLFILYFFILFAVPLYALNLTFLRNVLCRENEYLCPVLYQCFAFLIFLGLIFIPQSLQKIRCHPYECKWVSFFGALNLSFYLMGIGILIQIDWL